MRESLKKSEKIVSRSEMLDVITSYVIQLKSTKTPVCIAIDGPGCSGKTILASELKVELEKKGGQSQTLPIDNFCLPKHKRYSDSDPQDLQVYYRNFDYKLFEDVLQKLLSQQPSTFSHNYLNARSDTYSGQTTYSVDADDVLIVEGIHTLKSNFLKYYNVVVYLTVDSEVQLDRAHVRDLKRGNTVEDIDFKYTRRYRPSYLHYIERHSPQKNADFIVDNTEPENPVLEINVDLGANEVN